MPREPVLEVTGLRSNYGATPILTGVDLSIGKGEIVALIGRNGVGKTTTMRCLIGLLRASGGTIRYCGQDVTRLSADDRARLGIGYIPQGRDVFPRMTVEENLKVGELIGNGRQKSRTDLVFQCFPILKERRKQMAGTMSGGQQHPVRRAEPGHDPDHGRARLRHGEGPRGRPAGARRRLAGECQAPPAAIAKPRPV